LVIERSDNLILYHTIHNVNSRAANQDLSPRFVAFSIFARTVPLCSIEAIARDVLSSGALPRVGAIFCRAVCSDVQIAVAKVAVTELTGEGPEKSVRNSLGTGEAIVIMETDEPKDDQQNGDAERTNT
jgi:hypothetical protein